ncbi:alpha/beta hydrolase [Alcaligenaceae bacterium]|nr:alpha/beta hydrolase [Alcaligenaceae bacterium]
MKERSGHGNIRHSHADINGVQIHYAENGSPANPLMLFVHGFPEAWFAWKKQMDHFSHRFHVVTLDTRGINQSGKPVAVHDYRAKYLVQDIIALVRHLGHQDCILVGHDWGGAIAWGVAMAAPAMVRQLCILNGVHPVLFARELLNNPEQQAASQYMLDFRREGYANEMLADGCEYLTQMLCNGHGMPEWLDATALEQYKAAWQVPGAVDGGLNYYKASMIYPGNSAKLRELLEADPDPFMIRVPTLVLWGRKDRYLLPGCINGLDRFVDDLQVHTFDDASHWIAHEIPSTVNSLIDEFASRLS